MSQLSVTFLLKHFRGKTDQQTKTWVRPEGYNVVIYRFQIERFTLIRLFHEYIDLFHILDFSRD